MDAVTPQEGLVMPIEVHCPNPDCARIHQVKSQYSGMRGRCPACNAWMYVPANDNGAPSGSEPRHEARAAASRPSEMPIHSAIPRRAVLEEELAYEDTAPSQPRAKQKRQVEPAEITPEEKAKKPCPRRFSWLGTIFLLLGILGLAAVALSPYLDPGKIEASGEFLQSFGTRKFKTIDADMGIYTSIIPGAAAGVLFLFCVGGLIMRRQGFITLFFLYLGTIFSSVALFWLLPQLNEQATDAQWIESRVVSGALTGDAKLVPSQQLYAAVGGAEDRFDVPE